jgi:hypothetical protein
VVTRLWRDPALTASRSDRADVAVEIKRKKKKLQTMPRDAHQCSALLHTHREQPLHYGRYKHTHTRTQMTVIKFTSFSRRRKRRRRRSGFFGFLFFFFFFFSSGIFRSIGGTKVNDR